MQVIEFIVKGPPVSQQTRRRQRLGTWKDFIQSAVREQLPTDFQQTSNSVRLSIIYFYDRVQCDTDNIVKPIQDALKGLIYIDDKQVVSNKIDKKDINGRFRIKRMSPVIAQGFIQGEEFLYIKIEEIIDNGELT